MKHFIEKKTFNIYIHRCHIKSQSVLLLVQVKTNWQWNWWLDFINSWFSTGLYLLLDCECVRVQWARVHMRVLPVSMWSTGLNMWSDVRGKLLTLRPLSVLSLREWALHKKRADNSFCLSIPDRHLLGSSSNHQWKIWITGEQTKHLDYTVIHRGTAVSTETSSLRTFAHKYCSRRVDKQKKWDVCFLDRRTLILSSRTYGILFVSTLWWGQQE